MPYGAAVLLHAESLQFVGYRIETAGDGAEAIAKARALSPDVIVMDLSLPVIDGWEAIRQLKENPATAGIHIIAVTGHGERVRGERTTRFCAADNVASSPCYVPRTSQTSSGSFSHAYSRY